MLAVEFAIQLALIILMIRVAINQIVIPIFTNNRIFPAFSRPRLEIVDQIAAVNQEIETERLRHVLAAKEAELAKEKDGHHA